VELYTRGACREYRWGPERAKIRAKERGGRKSYCQETNVLFLPAFDPRQKRREKETPSFHYQGQSVRENAPLLHKQKKKRRRREVAANQGTIELTMVESVFGKICSESLEGTVEVAENGRREKEGGKMDGEVGAATRGDKGD